MTPKEGVIMSDFEKRFTLRMPSELFEQIRVIAEQNHRATAREIVVAIEEYVRQHRSKDIQE